METHDGRNMANRISLYMCLQLWAYFRSFYFVYQLNDNFLFSALKQNNYQKKSIIALVFLQADIISPFLQKLFNVKF